MKFKKGQQVVCIAKQNEWSPILNDLDAKMHAAIINKPEYSELVTVNEPMTLHYNGRCYLTLIGYGDNPFDELAFVEPKFFENKERETEVKKYQLN